MRYFIRIKENPDSGKAIEVEAKADENELSKLSIQAALQDKPHMDTDTYSKEHQYSKLVAEELEYEVDEIDEEEQDVEIEPVLYDFEGAS